MDYQALEKRIQELEMLVMQLSSSQSIPQNIEDALRERLGSINPKNIFNTTLTTTNYFLTGNVQSLDLPAAVGSFPVLISGRTYNVLYQ